MIENIQENCTLLLFPKQYSTAAIDTELGIVSDLGGDWQHMRGHA